MEIESYIQQFKEIQSSILSFIECSDDEFYSLVKVFQKQNILSNYDRTIDLLQLLSKIADNHQRSSDFFDKFDKIFHYIFENVQPSNSIPNSKICELFKANKRILLLLLEQKYLIPDDSILKILLEKRDVNEHPYCHFLYSGIKTYLDPETQKKFEDQITYIYDVTIEEFEENCRKGENNSPICSLIRDDSIDEFITYIESNNFSLHHQIQSQIYETNSYLMTHKPVLIEYASFFGSIRIIKYLLLKEIQLDNSMFLYGIHSNNPEIIELLLESKIPPNFSHILKESVQCHHNEFTDYICDNIIDIDSAKNYLDINYYRTVTNSFNFYFYPSEIIPMISSPKDSYRFTLSMLCSSLKTITIPSSVKRIGKYAFSKCKNIKKIDFEINSSIESFDDFAFSQCSNLEEINIPDSLKSIGESVFESCFSLKQINIPSNVIHFGTDIFKGIKSIEILGNLTKIPEKMFQLSSSLTNVSLPNSITSICAYSFANCSSLIEINIPSSVKSICENAFIDCSSLNQVLFENHSSLGSIEENAFKNCKFLNNLEMPLSVSFIGKSAFSGCLNLMKINIPNKVNLISPSVFYNCSSLEKIEIPSSVTSIGENAFNGCSSLKEILIPSSVTSIEYNTFIGCKSLNKISIPSSVTSIGHSAFVGCSKLKEILIPSSVTSIEYNTFVGCKSLNKISIPSSVTSIGHSAFVGCSSLKEILIPSSVTSIGHSAFNGCSSLKEILIPSSVTSIGDNAFKNCSSLKELLIPSSVTSIGKNVFIGCSSLTKVSVPSSLSIDYLSIGYTGSFNIITY